jgi:hypothetical protein
MKWLDILHTRCLKVHTCSLRSGHLQIFQLLPVLYSYMLTVLRASKSPFADMLEEYVNAEQTGQENGHGECWRYYKACPKSLFMSPQENKYL